LTLIFPLILIELKNRINRDKSKDDLSFADGQWKRDRNFVERIARNPETKIVANVAVDTKEVETLFYKFLRF